MFINNPIEQANIITGERFAEIADIIFVANISKQNNSIIKKNYEIINKNQLYDTLKIKNFELKNGDVIYVNSSYLELLFHYLRKIKSTKNLTLISGQSDRAIDLNIYKKKPKSITKWYSTNINFEDKNLISIPLGIANNYSPKNLRIDDFKKYKKDSVEKKIKLYINLQKNTNHDERSGLKSFFKNKNWVVYKEPTLTIEQYLNDLQRYKFVLCPWGNGFDTHRVWEVLYSGSIPVTKYHQTYAGIKDIPIIFYNNHEEINLDFLQNKSMNFESKNFEILDINYWKNEICKQEKIILQKKEIVTKDKYFEKYYWSKLKFFSFIRSKNKILKYYLNKLKFIF